MEAVLIEAMPTEAVRADMPTDAEAIAAVPMEAVPTEAVPMASASFSPFS